VSAPVSATLYSIGIKHCESLQLEVKPAAASEVEPVILRRHAVPDDNSCLFASVKAVVGYQGDTQSLRTVVVQEIKRHPEDYSEAVLGKSADLYCAWILKRESWGGAIELAIFAAHFSVEIVAVDIKTLHVYRYGEDRGYTTRVFVIYDGIHYDPIVHSSADLANPTSQLVQVNDDKALDAVLAIAREAKERHQYTDTGSFTLRCSVCKIGLVGEKEAQNHAMTTGHASFEEYLEH